MSFIPKQVCRICLWQAFPMRSLWSPLLSELGIANKMNTVFPFSVQRNDGLPSEICNQCAYKVDSFYEFYQLGCISYSKLRFCFGKDADARPSGLQAEKQEIIEIPSPEPSCSNNLDSEMPSAEYSGNFGDSNDAGNHELPPQGTESSLMEEEEDSWEDNQRASLTSSVGEPLVDLPVPQTRTSSVGEPLVDLPVPQTRTSSVSQSRMDLPVTRTRTSSVSQPTVDHPVPGTSSGKPASSTALSASNDLLSTDNGSGKKEKLLKCSHCRNEFRTRVEIALHFCDSPSNTPKRLSCRYCFKQFHDGDSLAIHKKKHINQFTQTCGKCGKMFKSARGLRAHINLCGSRSRDDITRPRTPRTPNHACNLCNRQFYSVVGTKLHFSSREHRANLIKLSMKRKKVIGERGTDMESGRQWEPVETDADHMLNYYSEAEGSDDVFENESLVDKSVCSEPVLNGGNVGNTKTRSIDGHEENKTNNQCLRRRTYSDSLWLVN